MIAIVDSGGANITSIRFALQRLGVDAELTQDAECIRQASHVILPGVGSAMHGMSCLRQHNLVNVLHQLQQPVLGICLGMQLLFEYSEEGNTPCLGIIPGTVCQLEAAHHVCVPHMGWNEIMFRGGTSPLFQGIACHSDVYYVHSFAAPITAETTAVTNHGVDFTASVQYKNFFATQFHPERSGKVGSMIIENFLRL